MTKYITTKDFLGSVWEIAKKNIPHELNIDYFTVSNEFNLISADISPLFSVDYGDSEGCYIDLFLSVKGTSIRCGSIKTLQEGPTAIRLMSALLGECVIAFWEVRRRLLNELDREGFCKTAF